MEIIGMSDITRLDPRLLLSFVAIYEECSVTRAAARLNITQQGLSGALARLRTVFDDPLFVRDPHGVSPTPFSDTTYPKVVSAIESLNALMQIEAFDPSTLDSTFCIATNDYALSVVIQPLFRHLRGLAPSLKLAVVPLQIDLLTGQMRSGQVDLALTVSEFLPDNLHSKTLFSDHYKCVFNKGHPLATRKLTIDEFCKAEHLLVAPNGDDMRSVTDVILEQTGHTRRVGIAVPSFLVAQSLLATTNLIGILPSRLLQEAPDSLFITDTPITIPPFDIISVWSPRSNSDPINIWMRESLRVLVGDR
jgi:DNA-binding transcriptional LysR family regulator